MRRLSIVALALPAILALGGCKRQQAVQVETVEEEGPELVSAVHAADPRAAAQLVRGFHDVEQNAWRWTHGKFAVTLKVPPGAADKGGMLELKFAVPESVLAKKKRLTISAGIDGAAIESESYDKTGEQVYRKEIPAGALRSPAVTINFALDKFLAAGEVESRELGVVFTSISLTSR